MPRSTWAGHWTLITGASAGIGRAFAQELASRGSHLLLTARRLALLDTLAVQLRSTYGVRVEYCPADLADPDAPEAIAVFARERGIAIDFLINNAGLGAYGETWRIDALNQAEMVRVNCEAVVRLTQLILPGMVERRRGDILIVSSTAGFQGVPYMATYAATKAFDLIFAEGLAREVMRYGIRVCALCPGSTETDFDRLAGIPTERTPSIESAEQVVLVGLRALESGRHVAISGFRNRLATHLQRFATRRLVTGITERMFRRR